jgi:ketosteroid isomerase-like protein
MKVMGEIDMKDEVEIRQLIDGWLQKLRRGDVEVLACDPAPLEARAFDLEKWFATWPGSAEREMRYLNILRDEGVAWCHSLNRVGSDLWVRATVGLQKVEGRWQITREHLATHVTSAAAGIA